MTLRAMWWALQGGVVCGALSAASGDVPRPTVYLTCTGATCEPIRPLPEQGHVDLVIVGARAKPAIAGISGIRFRRCTFDPDSWCARDIPAEKVAVTVPSVVSVTSVGPDVVEVSATEADDPFDDAVMVGDADGYWCSGVVLDATHVLTAKHCLPASRVAFGRTLADAVPAEVARSIPDPDTDAAVLVLATPTAVTPHARRTGPRTAPPAGRVRIVGYGVRDTLRFTGFGKRHRVEMDIDGWGCTAPRAAALGCRPAHELLIHDARGNDTCFGDSGGPVYERTSAGWRLVAITSRGTTPRRVLCGEGGIYVRVDALETWLEKAISR